MTIDADRPTLELHTQQFIDGLAGAPPIYTLSPAEARSVLSPAVRTYEPIPSCCSGNEYSRPNP